MLSFTDHEYNFESRFSRIYSPTHGAVYYMYTKVGEVFRMKRGKEEIDDARRREAETILYVRKLADRGRMVLGRN